MGNRFKIGDKVRVIKNKSEIIGANNAIGQEFVILTNQGILGDEQTWSAGVTSNMNSRRECEKWRWRESELELVSPTTFEAGKKYVPVNSPARGILTILAELNDGDFAYSFERYEDGVIIVDKLHPSSFHHYKEYIPPPPEEWRAVYWRPNSKPEISAAYWDSKSKCETYHDDNDLPLGERNFMYAIRTDINAKKEN